MLSVRNIFADYEQYVKHLSPKPSTLFMPFRSEHQRGKIGIERSEQITFQRKKELYSVFSTWLPVERLLVPAQSNPTYCSCLCRPSVQGKCGTEVV